MAEITEMKKKMTTFPKSKNNKFPYGKINKRDV